MTRLVAFAMIVLLGVLACSGKDASRRRHLPSVAEVEAAISASDDFEKYKSEFVRASLALIESGQCSLGELSEYGGWIRSDNHKPRRVYFNEYRVYVNESGPAYVSSRFHFDVESGETFRYESTSSIHIKDRQYIFRDLVSCEDRADRISREAHPFPEFTVLSEEYRSETASVARKRAEMSKRLMDQCRGEIASKYSITDDQLKEIQYEASVSDWPLPHVKTR